MHYLLATLMLTVSLAASAEERMDRAEINDGANKGLTEDVRVKNQAEFTPPLSTVRNSQYHDRESFITASRVKARQWDDKITQLKNDPTYTTSSQRSARNSSTRYLEQRLASVRAGLDRVERAPAANWRNEQAKVEADFGAMHREYNHVEAE